MQFKSVVFLIFCLSLKTVCIAQNVQISEPQKLSKNKCDARDLENIEIYQKKNKFLVISNCLINLGQIEPVVHAIGKNESLDSKDVFFLKQKIKFYNADYFGIVEDVRNSLIDVNFLFYDEYILLTGRAYYEIQDYSKASSILNKNFQRIKKNKKKSKSVIGQYLYWIGRAQLKLENYDTAEKAFKLSIGLSGENSNLGKMSNNYLDDVIQKNKKTRFDLYLSTNYESDIEKKKYYSSKDKETTTTSINSDFFHELNIALNYFFKKRKSFQSAIVLDSYLSFYNKSENKSLTSQIWNIKYKVRFQVDESTRMNLDFGIIKTQSDYKDYQDSVNSRVSLRKVVTDNQALSSNLRYQKNFNGYRGESYLGSLNYSFLSKTSSIWLGLNYAENKADKASIYFDGISTPEILLGNLHSRNNKFGYEMGYDDQFLEKWYYKIILSFKETKYNSEALTSSMNDFILSSDDRKDNSKSLNLSMSYQLSSSQEITLSGLYEINSSKGFSGFRNSLGFPSYDYTDIVVSLSYFNFFE